MFSRRARECAEIKDFVETLHPRSFPHCWYHGEKMVYEVAFVGGLITITREDFADKTKEGHDDKVWKAKVRRELGIHPKYSADNQQSN